MRVDRPQKTADIRIRGLEGSIRPAEVAAVLANKTGCKPADVQVGEMRGGDQARCSVWAKLSLTVARKAAEETIQVGWSRAKMDLLEARPLRCFRCLERGHVCDVPEYRRPIRSLLPV